METRAPFVIVGAFVLAAIGAVFGFVYWLHTTAGTGAPTVHHVQFEGSVSGLLVGATVLFNGIRVGEVTLLGLAASGPRQVDATIAVASDTPVHADTTVGLDFEGLTGVPVISLEGGKEIGASSATQTLVADPAAGHSMTQAARNALTRVDSVLAENAEPLKKHDRQLEDIFRRAYQEHRWTRRNRGRARTHDRRWRDSASKDRLQSACARKLHAAEEGNQGTDRDSGTHGCRLARDAKIPLLAHGRSSRIRERRMGRQYSKALQAKLIQGFENYDIAHAPLRSMDGLEADYQLLIDVRSFQIKSDSDASAEIGLSARILAKDGHVVASHLFAENRKLDKTNPVSAVAAFDDAFGSIATELIAWTATAL
jgi:phospholipid/cholesterol/gamma-HCH transport system substrate-binding protein